MKNKNKVLIIVHGVWPVKFHLRFLEKIRAKLFNLLTSGRGIIRNDYHKFKDYVNKEYPTIEILKWSGGISKKSDIIPAVNHLSRLLNKYQDKTIDIISFSLGGLITQLALNLNKKIKIRKILFAGSIHDPNLEIKNSKNITNVYSSRDKMLKLGEYFYTGTTNEILKWKNAENVQIKELIHDNLCQNKKINIDGKDQKLFDFYKYILS
jgi:predicted esterase YcpF (UPF0227 family)